MKYVSLLLALCFLLILTPVYAQDNWELEDGRWFTLYDQNQNVLLRTGIRIQVGDEFLDSDNSRYRVYHVDSDRLRAWAELVEDQDSFALSTQAQGLEGAESQRIGVYHTHSGESYQPTDGTDSTDEGPGGIYNVGAEFSQRLERHSTDVFHSQQTFFPYSGSYRRSRTKALEMVEEGLDAIFDIHRDAAPPEEYLQQVDDMTVTQVLIVLGTQNPTYRVNEEFAYQLKRQADDMYVDLVKGVFYAQGDYNQDVHPRALLLEMGAHTNQRSHAETGARAFADVVIATLYGNCADNPQQQQVEEDIEENPQLQSTVDPPTGDGDGGGVLRGAATLVTLLGIGGVFHLFISTGSWQGVREKVVHFINEEFKDVVARIPWAKLHPGYILAQIKAIKWGEGAEQGLPGKLKRWWDQLRGRHRI